MFIEEFRYRGESFDQEYKCYPLSFLENKEHVESGNKIIMPPSALNRLEEGCIYMPSWMMENLRLYEEDRLRVKNVTLPRGEYVKLQPHTKDFLDISNPKAILEKTLRNYSCLTTGDCIMVAYNLKQYYIDIVETRPSNAISIIETDCEVDFAPPLDYKDPERPSPQPSHLPSKSAAPRKEEEASAEHDLKFNPFTGVGRRLNGKASPPPPPPCSSSPPVPPPAAAAADGSNKVLPSQANGKLVFQANTRHPSIGTYKEQAGFESKKETTPREEVEPRFLPFTGKKYSLRG